MDDDILCTPESIKFILEFHRDHASTAANVSWEYPPALVEKLRKNFFGKFLIRSGFTSMKELMKENKWKENCVFESGEVASYFLSIDKKDFFLCGGYDERHLHEGTDIDLIERLRNNNIRMYINSELCIFHNEEDRIEMKNWMERKKRFGEISAHAVNMGRSEGHELHYTARRRFAFNLIYFFRSPIRFFIGCMPANWTFIDKFMFRTADALTGAYIHKGYSSTIKKKN